MAELLKRFGYVSAIDNRIWLEVNESNKHKEEKEDES